MRQRVVTFMSNVGGALIAMSEPLRRELDLWRWRRNFRYRLPAPIQDPHAQEAAVRVRFRVASPPPGVRETV